MLLSISPLFSFFLSMSFFILESDSSALMLTHLLYKTAVVIAVLRWILSRLLTYTNIESSSSSSSSQIIKDNLVLTTFEDVKDRISWISDTCAVCLSHIKEKDEVRELRNCCHVFHSNCIDRWVDHQHDGDDVNHNTCPLCRAPLLPSTSSSSSSSSCPKNQPSWAVERLLYLFGDDLLV